MTEPITGISAVTDAPAVAGNPAATTPLIPTAPSHRAHAAPLASPDLHALAATLNQRADELQTSLHFQVDKVTGQMVISVIDSQTNQVLMQVPGEEALAIAQSLEHSQLQLMKQSA